MSIYRSYFLKNNTLIEGNQSNSSQNPVGEISYGTDQATVSRTIFKIDLNSLLSKITDEGIIKNKITSHKLIFKNTIANRPDLLGKKSYNNVIERATSFQLDLFTVTEDWDEGSGYDFIYSDSDLLRFNIPINASNWTYKKTGQTWITPGAYVTGSTGSTGTSRIIATQSFPKGNEDIEIDITDFINKILFSGSTDYGLGLKFTNSLEKIKTLYRQAIAFHLKNTNTVFEPYLETIIDDVIIDDRKYFYMDKSNELYLYSSAGDVTVNNVTIYDYNGNSISGFSGTSITRVKKGVYKIRLNIDSDMYPDAVIFNDYWSITQNQKTKTIIQDFYLLNTDNYYNFDLSNIINADNYHLTYFGLKSGEHIKRGDKRKIEVLVKEFYQKQDGNIPLDLLYRLYMKQGGKIQSDIIPFTSVNRTFKGYEFDLDTSWLIPQDYYLELKFVNNSHFTIKSPINFTIVSDDFFSS